MLAPVSASAMIVVLAYVAMNVAYSLYLKHVAILDVTTIAVGFVLRLLVGSTVTGIPLSAWIVIMTFLLALFLALAKRRDDIAIQLDSGKEVQFDAMHSFLSGAKNSSSSYDKLAVSLQISNNAARQAVYRMRCRYGELLRMQISQTVITSQDVEAELSHLLSVLGN